MDDRVPAIAIVGAETPGNIGTAARAMKNFGFEELLLVDPPPLEPDGEAYGFAGHARQDVLPGAREISFEELRESYHTVGCSAVTGEDDRRHVRWPYTTPAELRERLASAAGPTAIVFGRERVGLTNEELAALDRVCSIPANPAYPVLNLGQAVTVVCYELQSLSLEASQLPDRSSSRAPPALEERLHDQFAETLEAIGHPAEKQAKTARMFRRIAGRADLTEREVNTLLGVFRRAGR